MSLPTSPISATCQRAMTLSDPSARDGFAPWWRAVVAFAIVALGTGGWWSAQASTRTVTAANIQAVLAAAQCGDTIKAVGEFRALIIVNARPKCAVTLDLTGAALSSMRFARASNWTVKGGTFTGARFMAIQVVASDHLTFLGGTYRRYGNAGISVIDSRFIVIKGNSFADANADGVDIVSSQDVEFRNNSCTLSYSEALHADCLQMWNKPGNPLTVARVIADGNTCTGRLQCIVTFGARDPRPISGITITNNYAHISTKWAGQFNAPGPECLQCTMKGNVAETYPGMPASWERPGWYNGKSPEPGNVMGK